jgi:hypothetical protein
MVQNCPTYRPQSMEGITKKMYKILVVLNQHFYIVFRRCGCEVLFERKKCYADSGKFITPPVFNYSAECSETNTQTSPLQ